MDLLSGLATRPCITLEHHVSVSTPPSPIAIGIRILNIVLLLPPAPAARVLDGRAFATLSALSAAAFLLMAVAGPPGGLGEDGRAVVDPVEGELTGEEGRGEDYLRSVSVGFDHASLPATRYEREMCNAVLCVARAF